MSRGVFITHVVMLTNGLFLGRRRPDAEFFHLQINLDGMESTHDKLRGNGAFKKLSESLRWLKSTGFPYTIIRPCRHYPRRRHRLLGIVGRGAG